MAAAALVSIAACGVSSQDEPRLVNEESVPFDLLDTNAPTLVPPATAQTTEPVSLCFISDEKLAATQRALDPPVSLGDVVAALMELPPGAPNLRTVVGPPSIVSGVRLAGGVVQVDFADDVSTLGGNNQLLAVAQLVCTLTARPGIGQVAFTLHDAPVDVPRADGSLTADPVSRDDYSALLP